MSRRTVEDRENGVRRGREDYEAEGEQSEAGSGIQRADAATLAQRRLLRLNPAARAAAAAAVQQSGNGGAFSNISTSDSSSSTATSNTPFVWGSGFYNPPQKDFGAPSASLVAGGKIDNDSSKDSEFAADNNKKKEESTTTTTAASKSSSSNWTSNPFTVTANADAWKTNPFASKPAAAADSSSSSAAEDKSSSSSSATSVNPFGGSNNFTFTFAAPPSSMPAAENKEGSSASNNDGTSGGAAALAAAPTVAASSNVESSDDTIYSTDSCKLYLFTKDEEGKSTWKERGGGLFKIILNKTADEKEAEKTKARLIMRNTQTKKGILHCPVDDSLKIGKVDESQVMFTSAAADDMFGGPPPKDTVQSFLLRANKMAGKEIIATIVKHMKEQQERVTV